MKNGMCFHCLGTYMHEGCVPPPEFTYLCASVEATEPAPRMLAVFLGGHGFTAGDPPC